MKTRPQLRAGDGAYWGFTLTDGALRMLVLLHFDRLGYSAVAIAFLFLFYEFFGIVTNLVGGWIAARSGLKVTLTAACSCRSVRWSCWPFSAGVGSRHSVAYVMAAQALSGIAKDLTKMSAKSAIKVVVPEGEDGALFRWVARLTGSKNALKGVGFFMGGGAAGRAWASRFADGDGGRALRRIDRNCRGAPQRSGKGQVESQIHALFSKSSAVNWLSAARLFLFSARDVWFVVGLPVFLASTLHWSFWQVGAFCAAWFVGYGIVQAIVPEVLRQAGAREGVTGDTARLWAFVLVAIPLGLAAALQVNANPTAALMVGLAIFMVVFAINSAVHSYLILAYSEDDEVATNVGFYYMANAGGRLLGTLLSGVIFEFYGFSACLLASSILVLAAALLSFKLPRVRAIPLTVKLEAAES